MSNKISGAGAIPGGVKDFVKTEHHDTYPMISPLNADLSGRHVLITGASRGIGRVTSLSFARAGASSIAVAARSSLSALAAEIRTAAKEAGRSEPQVVELQMDVTSSESVNACAKQVLEAFHGRIDIVIANHGVLEPFRRITNSDPTVWWQTYEVNVKGTYLISRAFLPCLQRKESLGIFIGMSSIGQHLRTDGGSSYQSGKLALHRICEFMCSEGAAAEEDGQIEKRVCAIAVHPGSVATEMGLALPEYMIPLLVDKPVLTGDMLVWLTKERREWLNGRYVSCNWDMAEVEARRAEIEAKDLLKMRMTY